MSGEFQITASDGTLLSGEWHGPEGAPVLIFSNSLGTTRDMWRDQAASFADTFRVLLYDTRGHGQSGNPIGSYSMSRLSLDVLEIMDGLDIQTAHFCGLSLGGMTGQLLAVRAPERFRSFTLAATSAYMGPPSGWQTRIDTVMANGTAAIVEGALGVWFASEGAASTNVIEETRDNFLQIDAQGYCGCCAAIRDMDMRGSARVNNTPTLIVGGEHDQATPPEHSQFLHEQMQGSTLAMLAGAHLINLEQPAAFNTLLSDFLRSS